jgi:ribosomal protein S18 acetylase RimI-like enzyme
MTNRIGAIVVRPAVSADAEKISTLLVGLSRYFTIDPNGVGAESFLQTMTSDAQRNLIANKDFSFYVAAVGDEVVGVCALKNTSHLYYLFVRKDFQGRGIARQLWDRARSFSPEGGNTKVFTVNSSLYAIPVYEKFGFKVNGERTEIKGIAYIPMRLELS